MKVWHISDPHLSFDKDWVPMKPMNLRKWSIGAWTYTGYLDRIAEFGSNTIEQDDFTLVTGDMVHDMREPQVAQSLRWLRHHIRGTIVICRGNHDKYWDVGRMRQQIADLPSFYILDEGEIQTIGPYTIGCYSNHKDKTQDFTVIDGKYLEMAISIVKQAQEKGRIPVMMSHYPVNLQIAEAIGISGLKAYLSGHIHCTAANEPGPDHPLNWDWYDKSAAQTDDKTINGCFFSTATTDVVQARHKQSFKEIKVLEVSETKDTEPVVKPKLTKPFEGKPEVIVLVGIPGSGKSSVARILQNKYGYVRINQDELGSRGACVEAATQALKLGKGVVIDRCNVDAGQRAPWIDLAKTNNLHARAVVLECDRAIALDRIGKRKNHETIKTPKDAEAATNSMIRSWNVPTTRESFLSVKSLNAKLPANIIADLIMAEEIV
jgi:predicted kinase/predicted phosphohydrolase